MATAAAANPTTMRPRREMQEVKAPEMFKFTKQGQELAGVLINLEPVTVKAGTDNRESQTIEYMIRDERGERITFLGTNDLNKKIQPDHIGHWIQVRYERDDNSFTKPGQSAAKVFKVQASKEKEPGY